MNFKQIKSAVTSRITKTNIVWATITWLAWNVIGMGETYFEESAVGWAE
jgi:hypothetical protein